MKKTFPSRYRRGLLLGVLAAAPLMMMAQIPPATVFTPDSVWHEGTVQWNGDGTCAYDFDGSVFLFVWYIDMHYDYASPYIYLFNKDHKNEPLAPYNFFQSFNKPPANNLVFRYPHEDFSKSFVPWLLGRNFAFQFDSRLWYYQHVETEDADRSYECFAEMPLDPSTDSCFHYYDLRTPIPDEIKQGAFQLDSAVWFIGRNENKNSAHFMKWFLQPYTINESTNHFVPGAIIYITGITGSKLGGYFTRLDSTGRQFLVLNTYTPASEDGLGKDNIGRIVPVRGTSGQIQSFTYASYTSNLTPFFGLGADGATIVSGTIKGAGRTSVPDPTLSDRFTEFYVSDGKDGNGNHPVLFNEICFINDQQVKILNTGAINLPAAAMPDKFNKITGKWDWDREAVYNIMGFQELRVRDYSTQVSGYDGLQQFVWFLYPDKKGYPCGAQFVSDIWRFDYSMTRTSTDLFDTISYPGINSLWTLNGILDGAPPCSMKWPEWDSTYSLNLHPAEPTSLSFTTTTTSRSEISNSYEDQWSIGESMDLELGVAFLKGTFSEEFKYSNTFKNTYSSGTEIKSTVTNVYTLDTASQPYGVFLWTVPQIARFQFSLYPWWDKGTLYPVPHSMQYLFRVTGTWIMPMAVKLNKSPFLINHPNGDSLTDWEARNRPGILNAMSYTSPVLNCAWIDRSSGSVGTINFANDTLSSFESTSSVSIDVAAGQKVPEVFEGGVSSSYKATYSTETVNQTSFGETISVSLKNLNLKAWGVNLSHLYLSVFWFRNDGNNWWYFDGMNGQKPWYVAYISSGSYLNIQPVTPSAGTVFDRNDLPVFTWEEETGTLHDFTVFVASSPNITTLNTLAKISVKGNSCVLPGDFRYETGQIYYWAVSGKTDQEMTIWSESSAFSFHHQEESLDNTLKALLYPNPGTPDNLTLSVESQNPGRITIRIFDLRGQILFHQDMEDAGEGMVTLKIPRLTIQPGIYLVGIQCGDQSILKKLIIIP